MLFYLDMRQFCMESAKIFTIKLKAASCYAAFYVLIAESNFIWIVRVTPMKLAYRLLCRLICRFLSIEKMFEHKRIDFHSTILDFTGAML